MAVLKASAQPEAARRFLAFLASESSLAVFARYGFVILPSGS